MDMNAAEPAASVETQLADLPHELLSLCARSSSNKKHLRLVSCGCRAAVDEEVCVYMYAFTAPVLFVRPCAHTQAHSACIHTRQRML